MKSNYVTPKVIVKVFHKDVITASTPEKTAGFDKNWIAGEEE